MTAAPTDQASSDTSDGGDTGAELSDRQHACLVRAGQGMSSKEIGRSLGISPSTVDNHIHVAVAKLHARNRWHAAQLLDPDRSKVEAESHSPAALLPPIGGRLNTLSIRQRVKQMLTIAAMALIVLTSAYVLILGGMAMFRNG